MISGVELGRGIGVTLKPLMMKKKQEGVLAFFARHNLEFSRKVGYGRSNSTYARYQTVLHHLTEYVRFRYRRDDVMLSGIRASFVDGFDTWLRKRHGLAPNTVWGYTIRNFFPSSSNSISASIRPCKPSASQKKEGSMCTFTLPSCI